MTGRSPAHPPWTARRHDWFRDLQGRLPSGNPHTMAAIMGVVAAVVREMAQNGGDVTAAVHVLVRRKEAVGGTALPQVVRRVYATANLVWHRLHPILTEPLRPPVTRGRGSHTPRDAPGDTSTVFAPAEVERLCATAAAQGPRDEAFVRLLFTTGLRIAAATSLTWTQLLGSDAEAAHVRTQAVVREKGGVWRVVPLCAAVRDALGRLRLAAPAGRRPFPLSVRQWRNRFYRHCQRAGLRGSHCHPHTARHTVVHALFAAGNSIELIAKYLGHRSLATTNTYYLRLSFAEVMQRIRLPWSV